MTATAFSEVEHDATRGALDLVGGVGAVSPKLCDHGAQGANQIQGDVIGNQHCVPAPCQLYSSLQRRVGS
ncbi:MAG TPA: hypothetical protein VF488_08695, partial [Gemmatimonadaceae bacterium]